MPRSFGPSLTGVPTIPAAVVASVADQATSTTLLAANADRRGASVFNTSVEDLYIKLGTTASLTDFTVKLVENAYYELPVGPLGCYTGRIDGIWAANGSGAALVTEY